MRVVFLSSYRVPDHVVDHYLSVLPRGKAVPDVAHCRARLTMIEVPGAPGSFDPLVTRVAESAEVRARILAAVRPGAAALVLSLIHI